MKQLLFFLLCLPISAIAQPDTVLTQLFEQFRKASTFDYIYPREKVYLHLDNNAYLVGDSIWYKAYVVRASTLRPTELSKVLYVELLDDGGHVLERQQVRIDSCGGGTGCFKLERPISNGFHEIRAFTREMLNWGDHACYSRVVPVFDEDKGQLDIVVPDEKCKLPTRAERPYDFDGTKERKLSFYPEGGNRIKGLSQRIAYQLTDGNGLACSDTLAIYDGEQLLTLSVPLHEGRGTFVLPAGANNAHVEVGKERFDLPKALAEGYTLYVAPDTNFIDVRIERTEGMAHEPIGLAVFCREKPCYFDTLHVESVTNFSLPIQVFHSGVNRIELFDRNGNSLASRMIYRKMPSNNINIEVRQSKQHYEQHAPIALEMYLRDEKGQPVQANLSLAVREDAAELIASPRRTIDGEMLLSSEVRGYIHRPDYYFEATSDSAEQRHRARALDELLMVQGWSATDFSTMCDTNRFDMRYPIEDGLVLNGTMYKDQLKKKLEPYPNMHLKLILYSSTGDAMRAECVTDSLGKFAFQATRDYEGEYAAHVFVTDEKGKSRWANVAIDRWFAPTLRKYNPLEFRYEQPQVLDLSQKVKTTATNDDVDLFEWKDTILDFRETFTNVAEVVGRRPYRPLQGNRYKWDGGEKKGRIHGEYFYNVELELEKWRDKGGEAHIPAVIFLKWLVESKGSKSAETPDVMVASEVFDNYAAEQFAELEFDGNSNNYSEESEVNIKTQGKIPQYPSYMSYLNGDLTYWMLNNDILTNPEHPEVRIAITDLLACEVQTAALVTDAGMIARLYPETNHKYPDQVFMVYERPNSYLYHSNKKVTKRKVWGYTPRKAFYSPNYYQMMMPKEPDNRRTLYWAPNVFVDDLGKATAVFFNNSHDGTQLRISIQGITPDGRMVSFER